MKHSIYILVVFLSIALASCSKDFETINKNPNSPEEIDPQFLLTNVISIAADRNTYDQGFRLANYLAQFAASVEFERIDRYEMGSNSTYWNTIYGLLNDIKSMQTVPNTNEAYIAIGDIMSSYLFSQLTDLWGDIPYTEALQAESGNTLPAYDSQEFIYTDQDQGILATLTNAVNVLASTNEKINGDVMFQNDLSKWIRFANALKVRYTLRISNKLSDFSDLQTLVDSGSLMESNSDNAIVPYLSAAPNQWPMSQASQGLYQEHRMTKTVEEIFGGLEDPRIGVFYKPGEIVNGEPVYNGLLNGQSRETISANNIDLNKISLFGEVYRDIPNGIDAQYMLYSEQEFAIAEAIERGYISGDASLHYTNAINAHFAYLGIAVPDDYLTKEGVVLDGENNLSLILTQKWISLVSNGHEAWFNVRRTGIPALTPGPDNLNDDKYPVRYLYPESEQATNKANYEAALNIQGPDNINTSVWWDK